MEPDWATLPRFQEGILPSSENKAVFIPHPGLNPGKVPDPPLRLKTVVCHQINNLVRKSSRATAAQPHWMQGVGGAPPQAPSGSPEMALLPGDMDRLPDGGNEATRAQLQGREGVQESALSPS